MSTRYEFRATFSDEDDTQNITIKEFKADEIGEILASFREFLLGVGFSPATIEKYEIE